MHQVLFFPNPHIESDERPPDVDPEILVLRLGEVCIGDVHIFRACFQASPRTQVAARAATQHQPKGEVLSLRQSTP